MRFKRDVNSAITTYVGVCGKVGYEISCEIGPQYFGGEYGNVSRFGTRVTVMRNGGLWFSGVSYVHPKDMADPEFKFSYSIGVKEALEEEVNSHRAGDITPKELRMIAHVLFRKGKNIDPKYGVWAKSFKTMRLY